MDLSSFLLLYAVTACAATLTTTVTKRVAGRWYLAGVVIAAAAVTTGAVSLANRGENVVLQSLLRFFELERLHIASATSGALCGLLGSMALSTFNGTFWRRLAPSLVYVASVLCLSVLVLQSQISSWLPDPNASASSGTVQRKVVPGFRVEQVAELSVAPTAMAIDPATGSIYVTGYAGVSYQNGVVVRLEQTDSGMKQERVATYLNRPHGLAFHKGDLFVSRSGQFTRAVAGNLVQERTGAITRLQDVDQDGVYEYYTDVISDLPGAQQPDGLHSNNGIAFGSDGHLYITVGAPSDHGPVLDDQAGTILRAFEDGTGLSVFARGFRNPFDLVFGRDGELFCTDNDSGAFGGGDEINHVVEGGHYGHPYSVFKELRVTGTIDPILNVSSAQGITYAKPGSLVPGFDDCLYFAAYGDDQINRLRLRRHGATFDGEVEFFASIPKVLDVLVAPDGSALYACSHDYKKVYRILPEK